MKPSHIISATAVVAAVVLGGAWLGGHFDDDQGDPQQIAVDPPATESQAASAEPTADAQAGESASAN